MTRIMMTICLMVVLVGMANAATVELNPTDWGIVDSANPDTSYWEGTSNSYIGKQSAGNHRFFVKFDLPSEIGANANITSAILSISANDPGYNDPNIRGTLTYVADDSWGSTLTYNNQPGTSGSDYNVDIAFGWARYPSEELVGMFSENGGETVSMRLRCSIENVTSVYNWIDQDSSKLTIEYVPEPATIGLLTLGFGFLRWKK